MKLIIFNAASGFGNRLLPIVSIFAWCRQNKVKMGVIWNPRAHRSGLPRDESDLTLGMQDYFDKIPTGIDIFDNKISALAHYDIKEKDIEDCDMRWQPGFDYDHLKNDYLLIRNCCHLISLFPENEAIVGQRVDLSDDNQRDYSKNPYIKSLKKLIREFVFTKATREVGDRLFQKDMIGLQLRNTDGGFTINASTDVINQMHLIIEENQIVYFSNDRPSDLKLVISRHKNVVAYNNSEKFLNNDMGSLYSLVDLYVLSKCKKICVASRSSFGLVAHLYSQDSTIEYWI